MDEVKIIAPVVSIPVECTLDRMIARDTARRIAGALGFLPAAQAQIGTVALNLTDVLLRSRTAQELEFYGVRDNATTGMCLSCPVWWLNGCPQDQIVADLQSKFAHLADEIDFQPEDMLALLTFWQK